MVRDDVASARRRLDDASVLWHRALAEYPDVDAFCREINSLLTTLRTVTWLLQKASADRPGFAEWYAGRQGAMRDDSVMRWAVDARNHVEKRGDLELRSTAKVTVLASWLEPPVTEFEVDPLVPSSAIAATLAGRGLPDLIREQGILKVERRWVTVGLPDLEILEACAHVYAVLDALLVDADSDVLPEQITPPAPTDAMRPLRDHRTARLHLASGKWLSPRGAAFPIREDDMPKVRERYGDVFERMEGGHIEARVRSLHRAGRRLLEVDKNHLTIALIFRKGQQVAARVLAPEDQAEKYLLMEQLSEDVMQVGGDEVILAAETWGAAALPEGHPEARLRAGQRQDRTEGFMTTGVDRTGRCVTMMSDFRRDGDQIVFADAYLMEEVPQIVLPLLRAWDEKSGTASE